jgi:outer membrane protein insertion porin family
VESVVYKGLAEMNETELQDAILVKEGDVFRKDLVEKSLEGIRKKYETKGLFNAIVTYNIKPVKDKENVKVEFVIDEGEEIKVKKITILGADRIYSKEITGLMETAEDGIFKDGNFNRETYEQDKAKILAFYKQNGYQDAQIIDDRVEYEWENPVKKEKRGIFITISVNEGEKYYFDKYSVHINSQNGKAVFKPEDISRDFLQKESGAVFDNTRFEQDRQMINMKYGSEGYIFTRVVPKKTVAEREVMADGVREKRRFISVDFVITEGSQAYIESIIIKGNKKTKDKVIRREIACKEGELFDSRKIQISREKVYNLGYFKQVNIDVRPGSREGYMNLVIDVEEQPSATISVEADTEPPRASLFSPTLQRTTSGGRGRPWALSWNTDPSARP